MDNDVMELSKRMTNIMTMEDNDDDNVDLANPFNIDSKPGETDVELDEE